MTESQPNGHLIERAAQRLHDMNADGLAQLLGGAGPASRHAAPNTGAAAAAPPFSIDAAQLTQAGMIDWARHHGRQADEFRIVQGHILQALAAKPAVAPARDNIIMVTSARPGEGKTYSSLNLAGSLTTCSRRAVILVDADIKRHTLTSNLGLDGRDGLLNLGSRTGFQDTDLLVGTPTAPPLAPPLLRILPVGVGRAESGITAGRFLIDALGQLADQHPECLIVVDTPPCLSSSGPSTLASLVGHVMMVVEAQQTQRAEVEAALDLIEACGSVVLMLNKVQLTGSDTFGAYGY